jgi:hypothetical protein
MKNKIIFLIIIGVSMLFLIGFTSAQFNQNIQTDSSGAEEIKNYKCNVSGNCERTCNSICSSECDESCNQIEQRNCNRGYGLRDGTCNNRGLGPRDGTGFGSGNCRK